MTGCGGKLKIYCATNSPIWSAKSPPSGGVRMMHKPLLANTNKQLLKSTAFVHALHRDYEARSCILLRRVGPPRFAADPSPTVLCCAYAVDNGSVRLWTPGDPIPPEFVEAANNPNWVVAAHGDHFESAIEHHIMAPRFAWPQIPLERHRSTIPMPAPARFPPP